MKWLTDGTVECFLVNYQDTIAAVGILVIVLQLVLYVISKNSTGVLHKLHNNISLAWIVGRKADDWITSRESILVLSATGASLFIWVIYSLL